jgi:adenylate kinase family enzyme
MDIPRGFNLGATFQIRSLVSATSILHPSVSLRPPIAAQPFMMQPNHYFGDAQSHKDNDEGEWQTVTNKPKSQSKSHQSVKHNNQMPRRQDYNRYPHHNNNFAARNNNHYNNPHPPQQQPYQSSLIPNFKQQLYQQIVPSSNVGSDFDPEALMLYREQALALLSDRHYSASSACDLRLMILLCGIPGCGKSTFSRNLLGRLPEQQRNNWLHLNQDALKTRHAVMDRTLQGLQDQKNIIIDRCNFDVTQRLHWIELARQCPTYFVLCVLLPNFDDVGTCSERAFIRGNSDGVHEEDTDWLMVCNRMKHDFVFPTFEEGIDGIYPCETTADSEKLLFTICGEAQEQNLPMLPDGDIPSTLEVSTSEEILNEIKN